MRLILSALFSFALTTIYCQSQQLVSVSKDTSIFSPKNNNIDKMPNAMIGKNPGFVYVGNNDKGFELYKSKVDNMVALKPDGTYYDNIGNGFYQQPTQLKISRSGLNMEQIDSLIKSGAIKVTPIDKSKTNPIDNNSILEQYKKISDHNKNEPD